ncbi:hypothetical protein H4R20_003208 [Coemansia guatemalensis]|uniref:DUF814-domain-containing protein n=1 Tax=Coemansia guatemalensis TaxID=2761395 RepID=A0A9W8HVQ7_9FUNG|nr:hypothetical protein H4R20_003208 [Coemansia guatemalensis]
MPSSFCIKLRKHLKARRLTGVSQIGMDRVLDFEFAVTAGPEYEGTYHVICEFYASGNVILTNHRYEILALSRVVHIGDETVYAVGKTYSLLGSTTAGIGKVSREQLVDWLSKAQPKDTLKRRLATFAAYGPALAEHVIVRAGLSPSLRVATAIDLSPQSPQIAALLDAYEEAYSIAEQLGDRECPGYISLLPAPNDEEPTFDDFAPWLFAQYTNRPYREFESFSDAADVFFSNIEAQRLRAKAHQQESAAERKLDAVKAEHRGRVEALEHAYKRTEEQARRIEMNLEFVDQAITIIRQAVAAGMDWKELETLVAEQKDSGNPVAERISGLNLAVNQITLVLDDPTSDWSQSDSDSELESGSEKDTQLTGPLSVDVDIFQTAFANAQRYYNFRRQAGVKHAKTLAVSSRALQSAEQKINADLKATRVTATVSQMRKPFWFEKFAWFVSSDGYLVLAGHDMQQNELLVKRHLRAGDAYVHADMHGAASVIVKNMLTSAPEFSSSVDKALAESKSDAPPTSAESIPPSTLFQAGVMSVCQSRAWDAKIVTSAWWVEAHQVSKTAPTGEYLSTGSFMIRGRKRFLPPTQLVYGFGFMFRLADDESIARHAVVRQQRHAIMTENLKSTATANDSSRNANVDDSAEDFSIVGGASSTPKQSTPAAGSDAKDMDFVAARKKYNLDEIDHATEDAFADADTSAARSESKRHISAKERRDMRKQNSSSQDSAPKVKLSKKEQRRLEEETKYEQRQQQQQQQKQQQMKRGQRGKAKKIKEKYAEQDQEDRDLRMALLGAAGKQDTEVTADSARSETADVTDSAVSEQQQPLPPSIVDQLNALSTRDEEKDDLDQKEPEEEVGADNEDDIAELPVEQLGVLDTLTSAPMAGDNLSFAIPVCAPYPALSQYKYRVKLVPGTMKKGKACKMAQTVVLAAADSNRPRTTTSSDAREADRLELETILANREKALMKSVPETDMILQMLGKVKVTAPNMESIKQKSKQAAKSRAKAKQQSKD